MEIRTADAGDAEAINAIYNEYVDISTCASPRAPVSLAERRAWLAEHGWVYPVVGAFNPVNGGEMLAWASLTPYLPDQVYQHIVELSVYVRHDARGRGVARALLGELLCRAVGAGHDVIVSCVVADQEASQALLRALGFRELVHEVGFRLGAWRDVVYFERTLSCSASSRVHLG